MKEMLLYVKNADQGSETLSDLLKVIQSKWQYHDLNLSWVSHSPKED